MSHGRSSPLTYSWCKEKCLIVCLSPKSKRNSSQVGILSVSQKLTQEQVWAECSMIVLCECLIYHVARNLLHSLAIIWDKYIQWFAWVRRMALRYCQGSGKLILHTFFFLYLLCHSKLVKFDSGNQISVCAYAIDLKDFSEFIFETEKHCSFHLGLQGVLICANYSICWGWI